jgi:hypothetical protein
METDYNGAIKQSNPRYIAFACNSVRAPSLDLTNRCAVRSAMTLANSRCFGTTVGERFRNADPTIGGAILLHRASKFAVCCGRSTV